jgi:hypothetical protein
MLYPKRFKRAACRFLASHAEASDGKGRRGLLRNRYLPERQRQIGIGVVTVIVLGCVIEVCLVTVSQFVSLPACCRPTRAGPKLGKVAAQANPQGVISTGN